MMDSVVPSGNSAGSVTGVTSTWLLAVDVSICALVGGVNGLVGGLLGATTLVSIVVSDSNTVLFTVEGGDGVGLVCFYGISKSCYLDSSKVLTFLCLGDWKQ
jgi:hypothetical protein